MSSVSSQTSAAHKIIATVEHARKQCDSWRKSGEKIAFVPTMGHLHAGHLALVEAARALADRVVVSIFVNPTQFDENEDFDTYPRTFIEDVVKLAAFNVDMVFAPANEDMYPASTSHVVTEVDVHGLGDILEGEYRPGFFTGVATVVNKLLNIIQPDVAVFGEKDYQQLLVIRQMVHDLMIPVVIHAVATVREASGLAMSSRNTLLEAAQRDLAAALQQCLLDVVRKVGEGGDPNYEVGHACQKLDEKGFLVDYVVVRRQQDLAVPAADDRLLVVLAAARLGPVRLIDNIPFKLVVINDR